MQEEVKEKEKEEKSMKQKKTQHTPTGRALGTQERTLQSQAVKLWAGALPACAKHSCGKKHLEVAVAQDILHCWSLELAVRGLVLAESVQITKKILFLAKMDRTWRTPQWEPPIQHARKSSATRT